MTEATLDAKDAANRRAVASLSAEAERAIRAGVRDAAAHAARALTDALDAATEGRPTIAKARRSRSYLAARRRLAGLAESLVAMAEAARESAYAESWRWWASHLDAGLLRPGADPEAPTAGGLGRARTAVLHGRTIAQTARPVADHAAATLLQTLALAGHRAASQERADALLEQWAGRTIAAYGRAAKGLMADAVALGDKLAGRDAIDPDLLGPDPELG